MTQGRGELPREVKEVSVCPSLPQGGCHTKVQTVGHKAHAVPCLVSLFLCKEMDSKNMAGLTMLSREPSL